ncbi:hypothetical protein H5410_000495 [Solanum commersonii]|uniref:Uncharacterized protein n=1 Tax=Solanum commersonii TaxID=4109 RepID=A0A9J6AWX8_SOLCO|nr:hypothetical protein H5410_000495 [Solanum commersonii]
MNKVSFGYRHLPHRNYRQPTSTAAAVIATSVEASTVVVDLYGSLILINFILFCARGGCNRTLVNYSEYLLYSSQGYFRNITLYFLEYYRYCKLVSRQNGLMNICPPS